MKKLAFISMFVSGVAFTAVGCSTQGGLDASGSAQTSAGLAGVQGSAQAGAAVDAQPNSATIDATGAASVSTDASAQ